VTIRDRSGEILYANRAAVGSMGFETYEQLHSRPSRAVMGDYVVEDEHGRPLTLDDVPSMRLVHDEPAEPLLMRAVNRASGQARWHLLKSAPLRDRRGRVTAAVTVIEDVTAVKDAEMRMRMLAESGRILASSLDYEQTLQNVAKLAVPALADWCAVDLIDEDLKREHVITTHRDPAKREIARQLRALQPQELDPGGAVSRVVATGASELFAEISDEQLTTAARTQAHLEVLRELQMRSAMIVPLRVPQRTIGVMTLATAESQRRLGQEDLELAEQLGRRAAVAVENSRLHTTLARVAETLQKSLLPAELPQVPGWELAALYRPAGADQRIDVGGDFYEVFAAKSGWFCVLGDVTGNGVGAASLTGLIRNGARFASRIDPRPAAVLHWLDEELRERARDWLCTALCARIRDEELVLSSAGHPPALIAGEGRVSEAPDSGPLLGAFTDARWPERTLSVTTDHLVLLYTDGVIETPGKSERYGGDRLRELLSEHADDSPQELLERLDRSLEEFRSGRRRDDVVALALRRRP